ncbi:MAG: YdcF family protein [Moraxellaceae bacterium]|nr:YdcF family protein [Pseudobdellovibrionaceae bacterium]
MKVFKRKRNLIILLALILLVILVLWKADQIISEPENLWGNSQISADCGVVLTGAPGRLREGFELLAQKRIKKLIASGVYKEARMIEIFPYSGYYPEVSLDDIYLEKRSETTFGNARHSMSLVEGLRCRDIILITSQIHMHRAYAMFKIVYPESMTIKKLTLPNTKSESGLSGLAIEVVKSLFYSIVGLAEYINI